MNSMNPVDQIRDLYFQAKETLLREQHRDKFNPRDISYYQGLENAYNKCLKILEQNNKEK